MPNPAYTIVLWEASGLGGASVSIGPTVPAGFLWVVRDVVLRFPSTVGWVPSTPMALLLTEGQLIVSTPAYQTVANFTYEFRDLRQSVDQGADLELSAGASGWTVRVTGYQLTAT